MRALISGGGTGGHIYPALAIADVIMKYEPDSEILYLGNEVGYEKDMVPKRGYPFKLVDSRWFSRENPIEMLKMITVNLKGIRQTKKIIKEFKPDIVVGTGGFVCFPVIIAGKRCGIKTFIHEQNAYPGKANRSLESFADKIFLGFEDAGKYFKNKNKLMTVGNPVRHEFFGLDKAEARKKLNIPEDAFVVFAFGGSQGAEVFSDVLYPMFHDYGQNENRYFLFGAGEYYYDEIQEKIKQDGIEIKDNVRIHLFIDDIPNYIAAADVVISRAGALSIAEICTVGRASIMVPSPNVTGNHQFFNAKSVADKGGAILIEEKDFTYKTLTEKLEEFAGDISIAKKMGDIARECVPRNSAEKIYEEIRKIL